MEVWWSLAMKNKHLDSQTPFWFLSFYAMLCLSSTERWLMCLHTLFSAPLHSQKSIFSFNKRFLNRVPADSWYPSLRSWQQTIFLCSMKVLALPFDPCFMKWYDSNWHLTKVSSSKFARDCVVLFKRWNATCQIFVAHKLMIQWLGFCGPHRASTLLLKQTCFSMTSKKFDYQIFSFNH